MSGDSDVPTKATTGARSVNLNPKSDDVIDTIIRINDMLKWPTLVIMYDDKSVDFILRVYEKFELNVKNVQASFYDVSDWIGKENDLLLTINQNFFPNISIVLVGGLRALDMLNYANQIDVQSNRTTDYRHKAQWVVVPTTDICVYSVLNPEELIIENVAIINSSETGTIIFTLSFDNKKFVHVPSVSKANLYPNMKYGFNRRHFLIATHQSPEFLIKTLKDGKVYYSGYAKTFSDAMSLYLNFTYEFVEPEDNQWGNFVNGSWDGLVGQLLRREVDMAVAELTLTTERESVVDFVLPQFFTQGLGLVFQKDDTSNKGWMNILQPLQSTVYYTILAATVGFSLLMYVMERSNPLNQQAQPPPKSLKMEIWNVSNLFVSVIGCSFLGSDGLRPRTCAGRLLTFALWLFCVVMAATYSGNLTASLTVRRENKPFSTLAELVELEDWKWGVHPSTLSATILQHTKRGDFQKTWSKIEEFNKTDPSVLSTSGAEHIQKALGGKYAYITLDPVLFMLRRNDCAFDTVTGIVQTQHVALAVSENSPYRIDIQRFLFHLFDSGVLELWEKMYYKDQRPRECLTTETIRAMFLEDIKGAFAALGIGVSIALGILVAECIWRCTSKWKSKKQLIMAS
ncbi:hypothetical protein LOTGIDRAFT_173635 [Lottia gigantea]|uniref:Ionotropic glutamate receptor L-glutamate and glycine-binding domain-containing protein n=1 Tax=Lottia gigantea TaxID=225164 RepID=V4AR18_LOTGI|nr:hypothetical protein LOTGIDRAFT_173635 [Lottia gigantea]ESO99692.1 hypothetical protein LOTGIDRAFT_173635 [Lottia gigantea]